ncbi:putative RDD family membrane protein YckC [Amycolatopsis thermoflava]|uniref:Putative RDD family membrane protein YckC n=1 Tax=Amycolatopsis thermoflava TaxID=84480 RepID=A0A3N2GTV4_9PSEU|nr:putative RDD family membrane protein YckC [Amycolatopsis thermoflava]
MTGEAVVLELPIAQVASRAAAFAIDVAVQAGALLLFMLALTVSRVTDEALLAALALGFFVLVRVGYSVLFETLGRGITLGKMAMGLRVVRDDGGPVRFRQTLTRALAGAIVDFGPVLAWSAVALFVSLFSPRSKRVGDYLAGTVVIRERAPRTVAPHITMPPALEGWAAQLDLTGLSDELALMARQYLARYAELSDRAREPLGHQLVQDVAARIGAPPPWGVPPWAYLQAVLAERRRRAGGYVGTPGWAPVAAPVVPVAVPQVGASPVVPPPPQVGAQRVAAPSAEVGAPVAAVPVTSPTAEPGEPTPPRGFVPPS